MNPIYAIMESPHRWLILAGIAFLAGTVGAMMMLAYAWPHWLDRLWLLAGLAATAGLLIQAAREWLASGDGDRDVDGARLRRTPSPDDR